MVRLNYFILDGVSPLIISWQTRFGAPVDSPLPNFSFLQRRPCKLASFHSTDVSVPIGLSLRGDVLAVLWNTPNTRAWVHTHTHSQMLTHTHSQKHPNTRCDTAVVAAGVDVCEDSLSSSLPHSLVPSFSCVSLFKRATEKKWREEAECVCVCVHVSVHTTHPVWQPGVA